MTRCVTVISNLNKFLFVEKMCYLFPKSLLQSTPHKKTSTPISNLITSMFCWGYCSHKSSLRTEEKRGLAHGLEAAAAVLVHRPVTGCQDHQHSIIGQLLTSWNWSLQETATPGCDHLTFKYKRVQIYYSDKKHQTAVLALENDYYKKKTKQTDRKVSK